MVVGFYLAIIVKAWETHLKIESICKRRKISIKTHNSLQSTHIDFSINGILRENCANNSFEQRKVLHQSVQYIRYKNIKSMSLFSFDYKTRKMPWKNNSFGLYIYLFVFLFKHVYEMCIILINYNFKLMMGWKNQMHYDNR